MEQTVKICSPFITRNGVRIYAKDNGLKAFCWMCPRKNTMRIWLKKQLSV